MPKPPEREIVAR